MSSGETTDATDARASHQQQRLQHYRTTFIASRWLLQSSTLYSTRRDGRAEATTDVGRLNVNLISDPLPHGKVADYDLVLSLKAVLQQLLFVTTLPFYEFITATRYPRDN